MDAADFLHLHAQSPPSRILLCACGIGDFRGRGDENVGGAAADRLQAGAVDRPLFVTFESTIDCLNPDRSRAKSSWKVPVDASRMRWMSLSAVCGLRLVIQTVNCLAQST